MILLRTGNTHGDFILLTSQLDAELNDRYGDGQKKYDAHNKIDPIDTAVIGYDQDRPIACGCFKAVDGHSVEIKRMFVEPEYRGKGLAEFLLRDLEKWARELGYKRAVLETGKGQPEAIGLYGKCGYVIIEDYGPYKDLTHSVCMAKVLP